MKISIAIILLSTLISFRSIGQDNESLGTTISNLTINWDVMSSRLNNYQGLGQFCSDQAYRNEVIGLLQDIHHYDSVLYDRLTKASRMSKQNKDINKAIEDIKEFEEDYDMRSFIHFLHKECSDRRDIEKDAEALKGDVGSDSYGGQIYIIESELNKYIKHITTRIDHVRKHVHHLHIR